MGLVYPETITPEDREKLHNEYWENMSSGLFGAIIGKSLCKIFKKENPNKAVTGTDKLQNEGE